MVKLLPAKCCCCCNLKTGGVILGWIGLVVTVFELTGYSVALSTRRSGHTDLLYSEQEDFPGYNSYSPMSDSMLITGIVCSVVSIVASISLIWGAIKENRYLVLPWLVTQFVRFTALSILTVIILVLAIQSTSEVTIYFVILFFLLTLVSCFYWYLWMCVLSFFHNLRRNSDNMGYPLIATGDYPPPDYKKLEANAM